MSLHLAESNLLAYSLQIALVILAAAPVPALLAMRAPRARLWFWHVVLAACLFLPLVEPWAQSAGQVDVAMSEVRLAPGVTPPAPPARIPWERMLFWGLAAGAALRILWLSAGVVRLGHYRRRSHSLEAVAPGLTDLRRAVAPRARLMLSPEIGSPVTFGALRPVVLLPEPFLEFPAQVQRAILCHELLHVYRHDWLVTIAEEIVRALFWFHPAVWWLLGKIHLSREQTVDREVIAMLEAPHEYVDALLAIAGSRPRLDLAPAPLFLRRRHLKQRVFSILKEGTMSKTRWFSALAAGLGVLTVACWLAAAAFPLQASPQAADAEGVTVDLGGAGILHRDPVEYPETARTKGVQGAVVVEAQIASDGTVNDARVVSGPDELRRAALQSVLSTHFNKAAAGSVKQVTVSFALPAAQEPKPAPRNVKPPEIATAGNLYDKFYEGAVFKAFTFPGLAPEAEAELRASLPVKPGDPVTLAKMGELRRAIRDFDSHIGARVSIEKNGVETNMTIGPAPRIAAKPAGSTAASAPVASGSSNPIRVGGNMQQAKLVNITRPVYPPEAKQAGIQGKVEMEALIDKEGNVTNLKVLSGDPMLAPSALEAVRTWKYKPTLLNGAPVDVITQIDVNYTLSK